MIWWLRFAQEAGNRTDAPMKKEGKGHLDSRSQYILVTADDILIKIPSVRPYVFPSQHNFTGL